MRDPRYLPQVGDKITRDDKVWEIVNITKVKFYEFPKRVLLQCGPGVRDVKSLTLEEYYDWAEKARPVFQTEPKKG